MFYLDAPFKILAWLHAIGPKLEARNIIERTFKLQTRNLFTSFLFECQLHSWGSNLNGQIFPMRLSTTRLSKFDLVTRARSITLNFKLETLNLTRSSETSNCKLQTPNLFPSFEYQPPRLGLKPEDQTSRRSPGTPFKILTWLHAIGHNPKLETLNSKL